MNVHPPDQRQHPSVYSAAELHEMLVTDAAARHATNLRWAIAAYDRIGHLTLRGAEAAFQAVLDDVEARTGIRAMPVVEPVTNTELAGHLGLRR